MYTQDVRPPAKLGHALLLLFQVFSVLTTAEKRNNSETEEFVPGFSGFGQPSAGRLGPYDANSTEYLKVLANSNATGVFNIRGFNVSTPFRGFRGRMGWIYDWTLSISLLELPPSSDVFSSSPSPGSVTEPEPTGANNDLPTATAAVAAAVPTIGYSITLKAPDSLLTSDPLTNASQVNADPTWGLCMWVLDPTRLGFPAEQDAHHGRSCERYLAPECIDSLTNYFRRSYRVLDTPSSAYGAAVICDTDPYWDLQCGSPWDSDKAKPADQFPQLVFGGTEYDIEDTWWVSVPTSDGVPVPYLNGSVTTSYTLPTGPLVNDTDKFRRAWDTLALSVWPVVTLWVNATFDPAITEDTHPGNRPRGSAKLHCIAPNGVGTVSGEVFTFSGQKPGTPQAPPPADNGTSNDNGKKDNRAMRGVLPTSAAGIIAVIWVWVMTAAVWWV
ncbi:hypothetical protein V8F06_013783 [Rhypophila decipiens]